MDEKELVVEVCLGSEREFVVGACLGKEWDFVVAEAELEEEGTKKVGRRKKSRKQLRNK